MTGPRAQKQSGRTSRALVSAAADSVSLEDFFENGAVPLHVVGGDGTILRANKAELELLGYSANDYIGRNVTDFHADDDVIADILARLTRGETLRRYPARLRACDGSVKHVEITSSGQFQDGRFINTRCFTMDVTDLVQARGELRRKDNLLQQVLDGLPAAVFMTDAAGKITYLNRSARELAQTEPRIGIDEWHTIFRLFTSDGEEVPLEQRPMYRALTEKRAVWGIELLAQRVDGSFLPVMVFPTPITDETGALVGAVNMFVDMSARKRAEDMFRLAVEAAPSAMILADEAGRIKLVNGAAERLFGYDREEMQGEPVEMLIPQRLRPDRASFRQGFTSAPEVRAMGAGRDLFALRKDGTEVPVEIGLNPVRTSQGLMVLGAINDISKRKQAAEREALLHREILHRNGNLFSVVHAIVSRTLTGEIPIDQARESLQARLRALARAHHKLAEKNWTSLDLHEVIGTELEPFAAQVDVDGPQASLEPMQVQNISLALHELTTNATKHGALSVPHGKVRISWSLEADDDGRLLRIRWEERGGPSVTAPTRRGFGSSLLKALFVQSRLEFAPEGLIYEIGLAVRDGETEESSANAPRDAASEA